TTHRLRPMLVWAFHGPFAQHVLNGFIRHPSPPSAERLKLYKPFDILADSSYRRLQTSDGDIPITDLPGGAPPTVVYCWCIERTNIDLHNNACRAVMERYHMATKRDAINFALHTIAAEPLTLEQARELRRSGWDGDLDELRSSRPT